MLVVEHNGKRIEEIWREYLSTLHITKDQIFCLQCSTTTATIFNEEKEQIFFFLYVSPLYFYYAFTVQISIFFSLPIPCINIIIADRQTDWLNIYTKDMHTPHILIFWAIRPFFLRLFAMVNSFFPCSLCFIVCICFVSQMLPSQYALSVCFLLLCRRHRLTN